MGLGVLGLDGGRAACDGAEACTSARLGAGGGGCTSGAIVTMAGGAAPVSTGGGAGGATCAAIAAAAWPIGFAGAGA